MNTQDTGTANQDRGHDPENPPTSADAIFGRCNENNPFEADHGQLKRRLRPMRELQTDRTAQVVVAGHAFVQNLRRGQYDIALDTSPTTRLAAALAELARAI